jgi:CRP-like cAMP-binding protein
VEDDLRAAGDRIQAEVGLTMGPLGERLDPTLLSDVTGKLTLRVLTEHEVYAMRGKLIPGLMVVGAGELELVGDGDELRGILHGGEFLFPAEVLSHAPAPATARAGKGGALILFADRAAAQELLVTCPPLLEIFAGG